MASLKQDVVHGLKWSFMAKLISQLFAWISTFWVLRLLTPEDYGIVAIAMVFFMLIGMFANNGLISALVRRQELDVRSSSQIFTLSLLINLSLSLVLFLIAPLIAQWYDNPALKPVIWVMACLNPISSFSVVPQSHLQIQMRFKEKSIVDGVSAFLAACVALLCAYMWENYWALIAANVVLMISRMVGMNWIARSTYRVTFDWQGARELFVFAMHIQMGTLIWFVYNKADTIIVARSLGVDKAGVYNVAGDVASLPMSKINAVMNEVAFSAFTKTKNDLVAAGRYLKKALRLMGVVAFPMFYGIAAVAPEAVSVILGEKWVDAGSVIRLLCLILPLRMLVSVMNNYAIGMGETKFGLINASINASVMVMAITIGAQYGLNETALAWVVGFSFIYGVLLFRFHRKFHLKLSQMMPYWPVAVMSALMFLVILLLGPMLSVGLPGFPVFLMLLVKIAIGIVLLGPWLIWQYGGEIKALFSK